MAGGIGFTWRSLSHNSRFRSGPFLEITKLAILCGSGFAGILSLFFGYRILNLTMSQVAR
jgi:Na+/H+ antiporter NhaA